MPKLSPATSSARRADILDAARRCFARHGIQVSVDDICAEAKVSKGALYGYFASKDAIIQAIADAHVEHAPLEVSDDPAHLLGLLLERVGQGQAESCRLEVEAWTYSLNHPALRDRLLANADVLTGQIQATLTAMAASGRIGLRLTPLATAQILQTFAIGLVAFAALGGTPDPGDVETRFRALLDGLLDVARP
jgi:AcrR family transcriptional regulator